MAGSAVLLGMDAAKSILCRPFKREKTMNHLTSSACRVSLLVILLTFLVCSTSFAAPSISISYAGNGVFTINGKDLVDVAGFDFRLRYDQNALANPRVDKGALIPSAMMVPNTSTAGTVIIPAMQAQGVSSKGGVLASITFEVKGNSQVAILGMEASLGNSKGEPIPIARPTIYNPPELIASNQPDTPDPGIKDPGIKDPGIKDPGIKDPGVKDAASNNSGSTYVPSNTGAYIVGGTITPPTDQASSTTKAEDTQTLYTDLRKDLAGKPKDGEEAAKTDKADEKPPEDKYLVYKGVLQAFKAFTGEKSPTSLILLFADRVIPGLVQEPKILFADGKVTAKISISPKLLGKETPSFAVSSAKILTLAPEEDGSWTLVVQPNKGATDAVLSISYGKGGADIPLTVVPPIDPNVSKSGKLTEGDFLLFLKETGTPKVPKYDLNGDGRRDYLDDYIFTANYIVNMKIKPESLKPKDTDQKPKAKETGTQPAKTEGKVPQEPPAAKGSKPALAEPKPADAKPSQDTKPAVQTPVLPEKKPGEGKESR